MTAAKNRFGKKALINTGKTGFGIHVHRVSSVLRFLSEREK